MSARDSVEQKELLHRAAIKADLGAGEIVVALSALENGRPTEAVKKLREAQDSVEAVVEALAVIGAGPVPLWQTRGEETPLELLDTPKTRALLAALRDILPLAEAVDAERGHVIPEEIPLLDGETRGTGWAETLATLTLQLELDIEGPRGRD